MAVHHDERRSLSPQNDNENYEGPRVDPSSVASRLAPLLEQLFTGGPPVRFVFWDGSATGPEPAIGVVVLHSPQALTRLIWSPDELGIARAFVAGEIDFDGPLFSLLDALHGASRGAGRIGPRALVSSVRAAMHVGALHLPPPPPRAEIRLKGWRHSKERDASAISHHYDVGNDFYRLVLGPAMTYSCARFEREGISLEDAQRSKHDLICRKLGLHSKPGARLLDVGCGWGTLAIHAAQHYDARVVAITLSTAQAELARARVEAADLSHAVEVRIQDYREIRHETFDAISSVGMFEHVGLERMDEYFATLFDLLTATGRLLNHAISTPGGSKMKGRRFVNRYVFPDGELIDLALVVGAMQRAGFEVRDVESLREHYSETLHAWVDNLEQSWEKAVAIVGSERARVWRLYLAASANGFDDGGLSIHQVLGVSPSEAGDSAMERTRDAWMTALA